MSGLAALGLAAAPWPVSVERVRREAVRQFAGEGIVFDAAARATFSLLPVPRLKLAPLTINGPDGRAVVSNAIGRAELRVLPLLFGRVEFAEVSLTGATISVEGARLGRLFATPESLRAALSAEATQHLARIVLRDCTLVTRVRPDAPEARIEHVGLDVRRAKATAPIDVVASGRWRGKPIDLKLAGFDLAAIADGKADPIDLSLESDLGTATVSGSMSWNPVPRFAGLLAIETRSLDGLLRWTGVSPSLADFDRPLSLKGDALVTQGEIGWPQLRVQFGAERATGSLLVNLDRKRAQVRATLAAEQIDIGWVGRRLLGAGNAWSTGDGPLADYDLRLSASELKAGALRFSDAAASILVDQDRFELTLARAGLAQGTVKARLSGQVAPDGRQDLRGQISADKVDAGALLSGLGRPRLLAGRGSGQATFETFGEGPIALTQELRGRAFLSLRDGELPGLALGEVRQAEPSGDGRPGRTPFGQAYVNLTVANGSAEIVDGAIEDATSRTTLAGRVSLTNGTAKVTTVTQGMMDTAEEHRPRVIDMSGPLDRLLRPQPLDTTASVR